jgi:hypothetical protein
MKYIYITICLLLLGSQLSANDTVYEVKGSKKVMSSNFIPIEEGKIYKLSGEFRAVGDEPSRLYFGYALYNKNKQFIHSTSMNYVDETDTVLVKPCKPMDKIIYVKNATNWTSKDINSIAFNTDKTGHYADLPNFNLSSMGIQKINISSNYSEIILKNICGKSLPKGTNIREHTAGANYIYNVICNILLTNTWASFSNLITTVNDLFTVESFYPTTKYIKLLILANNQENKGIMQFKNIKIEDFSITN